MKKLVLLVVCMFVSQSTYGQQLVPIPEQPQGINRCAELQQDINIASGNLNGWQAILAARQASLVTAQNNLNNWQTLLEIFWQGVAEQQGPMSPGQEASLANIIQAINGAKSYIRQLQVQIVNAQMQINTWAQRLQQAQQAFAAAGC